MPRAGKRTVPVRTHVRLRCLSFLPDRNGLAHLVATALDIRDWANRRRHWLASAAALPQAGSAQCTHRFRRGAFRKTDAPGRAPAFSMARSEPALQREVHPHADAKDPGARAPGKLRGCRKLFPAKAAVRPVPESHRFLGVLQPTVPAFRARTTDRDCLPTHPQSAYRSTRPGGTQPIWPLGL